MNVEELTALERQVARYRAEQEARPQPAPGTITLDESAWSYDWEKTPKGATVFGIRFVSGEDLDKAEFAAQQARKDGGDEAYRSTLLNYVAARTICDPNDFTSPHPALDFAEDALPRAFTRETVESIIKSLAKLHIAKSPIHAEADDDEMLALAHVLMAESPFADVTPDREHEARRYLRYALELITQ